MLPGGPEYWHGWEPYEDGEEWEEDSAEGAARWGLGQVQASVRVALPFMLIGVGVAVAEARARVLLTWVLVVALALAAVSARLPWYVLPVYPAQRFHHMRIRVLFGKEQTLLVGYASSGMLEG